MFDTAEFEGDRFLGNFEKKTQLSLLQIEVPSTMARKRRVLLPNNLHFITTRVQEGLPFVPTQYMNMILLGIVARAQELYKVRVCAFLWMGNHLHMLIIVDTPQDAADFINRIKTEASHAVNILLGRTQHSVWCSRYDSPPVLTPGDAVAKFAYIYANPAQADLETTISKYPGLSSWGMFTGRDQSIAAPWIQRPMLSKLLSPSLSPEEDQRFADYLRRNAKESHTFTLSPDDWLECFGIPKEQAPHYRQKIIDATLEQEIERFKERTIPVMGSEALKAQAFNAPFTPKKFARRAWCVCSEVKLRKEFEADIRGSISKSKRVYAKWKCGDFSEQYPQQLFAPRVPFMPLPASP